MTKSWKKKLEELKLKVDIYTSILYIMKLLLSALLGWTFLSKNTLNFKYK